MRTSARKTSSGRCAVRNSACSWCSSLRSMAGLGGGAFDSYRVCERLARVDIGVATAVFATFLGTDPILVGATDEQRKDWLGAHRRAGHPVRLRRHRARGRQRPGRHEDHGHPIETDGQVTGYRINGRKQWISNGSIADVYSVLALAPGGPSWFIVEKGTAGLLVRPQPEDKHGIRLSNTAALFLDDVVVPAENLVGRRGGPRPRPGPAGLRLHPADGRGVRPGRRLGGAGPRDRLLAEPDPGRRPAVGQAGLHPQADRAARGPAGGRARVLGGDRRAASTPARATAGR